MATAETLEQSVQDSKPIEVYTITIGSEVFRYTSTEDELTIGGNPFEKIPISRNNIVVGSERTRRTMNVQVPATNPFVQKYIEVVPGQRATVNLFRYQRDESPAFDTTVLLFQGDVQSVNFTDDSMWANIIVRSSEVSLSRNIPRVNYSAMCGAFLYDRFCGADPSLHNHIGTVTLVSGDDITVTGAGASGHNFVGGYCRPVGEEDYRMIIAQSTDVLTLREPFHNDQTSVDVQAFAGCDHIIDGACALVFDRVIDFLGSPFVPNKDIFSGSGIQ